jgi:hypothetical protein
MSASDETGKATSVGRYPSRPNIVGDAFASHALANEMVQIEELSKYFNNMAHPKGFEPLASAFGAF